MDTIIFGNYTLGQVLYAAGGVVLLIIFLVLVLKLLKTKEPSEHVQIVQCKNCGWQGQVSRYAGRCPKCNEPLGDRLAKKMKQD